MDAKTRLINFELVKKFLIENANLYTKTEIQGILGYLKHGTYPELYHIELVREILDILGLIPEDENIYSYFTSKIERTHGVEDRNIIEVGCGVHARLSERIHLRQNKGTLTIYDPRLNPKIESTPRFILKREMFTKKTDTKDSDLLVGLMPCKGAEFIIDQALEKKIDFIIWLCEGGPHGECFDYYEDEEEWLSSMVYYAKRGVEENNMGILKSKIIKRFSDSYPIIYNSKN